jgi:hypothetical protein
LRADPFSGYLFIFRTRRGTAIRVLQYDGEDIYNVMVRLATWPEGSPSVVIVLHRTWQRVQEVIVRDGLELGSESGSIAARHAEIAEKKPPWPDLE